MEINKDQNLKKILDFINIKNYTEALKTLNDIKYNYQNNYEFFHLEGIVYSELNQLEKAIISIKKSVKIKPTSFLGYYNIGLIYLAKKEYLQARKYFERSIFINNDYYDSNFRMAYVCRELGDLPKSVDFFQKSLKIKNNDIDSLNYLGLNFFDLKFYHKAFETFKKCILIDPNFYQAYNHIGLIYAELKKNNNAIFFFNKAISLKVNEDSLYYNLSSFYSRIGDYNQAISTLKSGIEKNPDSFILNETLATTHFDFRNFYEYEKILAKIEAILDSNKITSSNQKQNRSKYYELLGNLQSIKLNLDHSIASYKKAYNLQPGTIILSKILFSYLYLNYNFDEYFYFTKKCRELFNVSNDNFLKLNNNYENISSTIKIKHKSQKNFKIKIGFISSDLRNHSVGFQVYPVLKELSKKKDIQLYAYYNYGNHDKTNERFKEFFYVWKDINKCSDLEVVNFIRSQKIDILIDLNGYTRGSRLGVLVQKPAPIQVEWCGYLASVGFKEIDYIIQDPQTFSSSSHVLEFVEKKLVMPHTWSILEKNYKPYLSKVNSFKKNGFITFGSFNSSRKINLKVIALWSKILLKISNSKLLLKNNEFEDAYYRESFKDFFRKQNVNTDQLIFEGPSNRNSLLERYNDVDIVLDTFPYNGGTTNLEAAWMCVPILTLKGNKFISLCGTSVNFNLGLDDWIALSEKEYYQKAIDFAKNVNYLEDIKNKLINNRENSILFDSFKFSENLYIKLKEIIK